MKTVAICGDSVVLASMRASLERSARFRILSVDADLPGADERFSAIRADVIVFDLALQRPDSAVALCKAQPQVLLIGVDPAADHVLMFSGQAWHELTPDELVNVIERHEPGAPKEGPSLRQSGKP